MEEMIGFYHSFVKRQRYAYIIFSKVIFDVKLLLTKLGHLFLMCSKPPQENGADVAETDGPATKGVQPPRKPSTGEGAAATMSEAGHSLQGSESDLVLLPLRLAFETRQPKLVEPALDCLHVSCSKCRSRCSDSYIWN